MNENGKSPAVVRTGRGLSVAGTRITLYDIMDYLKADWPPTLIQQWFDLSSQQMTEIMSYIGSHRREVEAEYQEVLKRAQENRSYWESRNRNRLARIAELPTRPGREAAVAKLRDLKGELLRS